MTYNASRYVFNKREMSSEMHSEMYPAARFVPKNCIFIPKKQRNNWNRNCQFCKKRFCNCNFCNFCMKVGHTEYECWNRARNWQIAQDFSNYCYYCKEHGHRKDVCPLMLKHQTQGALRKAKCQACGAIGRHYECDCEPTSEIVEEVILEQRFRK